MNEILSIHFVGRNFIRNKRRTRIQHLSLTYIRKKEIDDRFGKNWDTQQDMGILLVGPLSIRTVYRS